MLCLFSGNELCDVRVDGDAASGENFRVCIGVGEPHELVVKRLARIRRERCRHGKFDFVIVIFYIEFFHVDYHTIFVTVRGVQRSREVTLGVEGFNAGGRLIFKGIYQKHGVESTLLEHVFLEEGGGFCFYGVVGGNDGELAVWPTGRVR